MGRTSAVQKLLIESAIRKVGTHCKDVNLSGHYLNECLFDSTIYRPLDGIFTKKSLISAL